MDRTKPVEDVDSLSKLRELTEGLPPLLTGCITSDNGKSIEYKGGADGINAVGFGLYNDARIAAQRVFLPKGCVFPEHQHDEKEWLIIFSGALRVIYDRGDVVLRPGESIYFQRNQTHSAMAQENTWLMAITIPSGEGYPDA